MTKKPRRRPARKDERKTNWYVIGGIVGVGIVGLFILMFASMQNSSEPAESDTDANDRLLTYCESNPDNCMAKGDVNAPVTVIEISDYGCGHCRNFNVEKSDALDALYVENGDVRWIVMPFALQNQSGQLPTGPSAVAAMCANEQGSFFDFHHTLFERQGDPNFNTEGGFLEIATDIGMDVDALSSCLDDNNYADVLRKNVSILQSASVRSTPTFFIGGRRIEGNLPNLSDFQNVIDAALGS